MRNYIFIFLLISLFGCSTPKQFTDYYMEDNQVNLFAFVGKKISIINFNPNTEQIGEKVYNSISGDTLVQKSHIMDFGYRCKYLIAIAS